MSELIEALLHGIDDLLHVLVSSRFPIDGTGDEVVQFDLREPVLNSERARSNGSDRIIRYSIFGTGGALDGGHTHFETDFFLVRRQGPIPEDGRDLARVHIFIDLVVLGLSLLQSLKEQPLVLSSLHVRTRGGSVSSCHARYVIGTEKCKEERTLRYRSCMSS